MGAGCAALATFGSDEWNAKLYDSLSAASRLVLDMKTHSQVVSFAFFLWRLNGRLESFSEAMKKISEGELPAAQQANISQQASEPYTPERGQNAARQLEELSRLLAYIYEQSQRRRLTNNSLTAGQLSRLNKHAQCILDLSDWLHVLTQPEEIEGIFNRAIADKERADIFDISQVR